MVDVDALHQDAATTSPPKSDPRPAGVSLSSLRRRKLRKGTRSCWECKRRKIRCIFASPDDVTCNSCERRRAPCVSQDMPEHLSPAKKGNRHLGERIARVEDFMKDILATKDAGAASYNEREPRRDRTLRSVALNLRSNDSAPSSIRAALTPAEVRELLTIKLID